MNEVAGLIERAASKTGSEYKLAKAMQVPQTRISDWKHGRATCTPPDRARIAGFAGEDAVQELVRATLSQTAGTVRGEQLARVLGKLSHQTGAVRVFALHAVASLTCTLSYLLHTMYRTVKYRTVLGT